MQRVKKIYIAEMLLEKHLITKEQLEAALVEQEKTGKKIGQILVEQGYIEESNLLRILSEQLNIPFIDIKNYSLDPELVKLLPEFYARHFRAIVLRKEVDSYLVGMIDPQDFLAHEELEQILKAKVHTALISAEDLQYALDNTYRRAEEISRFAGTLSAELKPVTFDVFADTQAFATEDMPVVNLLRSIFEDAAQVNASDIHIEPGEYVLRIRIRIDGVLQEQIIEEKDIAQALVQRIKLISGLNIAEKRLPQDGRFSVTVKGRNFDVRVSTLPVQYGESLVMRLLSQSAHLLQLEQIWMHKPVYEYYRRAISAAYGLLLIVGHTGSGKTTTLYASLNELNKEEDKIITVEDPVEYRLPRINQVQVNAKINLTFANVLRSILRQDPDIVMVGELRDFETMEIAIRAAMTGHLVLSTLHTNDTISTAMRLLDMGAEGYLIAGVLRAILAQRLVRRICQKCIEDYSLTDAEKSWLKSIGHEDHLMGTFKHGKGCQFCHRTGYLGRVGIFELLPMTDELIEALRHSDTGSFFCLSVKQPLYHSLLHTGLDMVKQGVTTVQEIINMAGEI